MIFFSLFISVINVGFSQTNINTAIEDELESKVEKMFNDMHNRDYDAILEMSHPKLFDFVSKEQLKDLFKSMFEGNSEFSIDVPKVTPKYNLSSIYHGINNHLEYAFVSYDMKMKMNFKNQTFNEETKKMMISMMELKDIKASFMSDSEIEMIMRDSITILLKDDSTKNKWVMVNYDPDSPFFYKILTSELLEKVKEYKQDLMLKRKKESEK